ncbi:MAG: DUF3572 domain-containing protein [Rhodospirillales bacterium]|tara:strand:+ start:244 stop:531 length:288 start_codon:yes stop_codon:yes gene_type:complete
MNKPHKDIQYAETIALRALEFILVNEELRAEFLSISGLSTDDITNGLQNPEFLGGVLDFLLQNELPLIAFCDKLGIKPEQPMQLRYSLPGANYDQ